MSSIRVDIVGAGSSTTARHLPGLQAIDGVEVVSVCIRGQRPVTLTTFAAGCKYVAFTEAVAASVRERRAVPVPA